MALGEFEIIDRYFRDIGRRADVLLGVGDDAAVLAVPPGQRLVATVDTIVDGVHFPHGLAAEDVGWRALAVNLSDIAAMGALPAWATLSLSLPEADAVWLERFAAGLAELAVAHDVALVGGDTVRGPLVVTVQVLGLVESHRWLTRSGARPGDRICVSGSPGDAGAGLELIQRGGAQTPAMRTLVRRFARPEPRIALGRRLRTYASAAMDVSDGLLVDLGKLCAASGCGADLDLDALPISSALRHAVTDPSVRERHVLTGGDDYELLFTIGEPELAAWPDAAREPACTAIGRVTAAAGVRCLRAGVPVAIEPGGYDHFRAGGTQ
jgi:thiamine-monophosphate kinase